MSIVSVGDVGLLLVTYVLAGFKDRFERARYSATILIISWRCALESAIRQMSSANARMAMSI